MESVTATVTRTKQYANPRSGRNPRYGWKWIYHVEIPGNVHRIPGRGMVEAGPVACGSMSEVKGVCESFARRTGTKVVIRKEWKP